MADVSPSPSSEFDFPSLSLDAEALAQIEAVSVAAVAAPPVGRSNPVSRPQQQQHNNHAPRARGQPPPPPAVPVSDNQYSDDGFFSDTELSEEKLRELDSIMASAQTNTRPSTTSTLARPAYQNAVAGPSRLATQQQLQLQRNMHIGPSRYGVAPAPPRQADLLGGFAHLADGGRGEDDEDESHLPSSGMVRTEGKKWDRTAYAATGRRIKPVPKVDDEEEQEEEAEEEEDGGGFEQFPAPFVNPHQPLSPNKHALDLEAIKTWIFPINLPLRQYQLNICAKSLFQNTLVALPTGLGKTFVAGVLMLNYSRWFPTGKIFFITPTKTLVLQQSEAFPQTCGYLTSKVVALTGEVSIAKRKTYYPTKTVFFMTAQTLANDIRKGVLDARDIILLVVDEAHKATGNAAYCQVVSLIQSKNHHFRLLALTATPSGKVEGIQSVIDNLHISHIEIRDEESLDIYQYVHKKHTELIVVKMTPNIIKLKDMMCALMLPLIKPLIQAGIMRDNETDPTLYHSFRFFSLKNKLTKEKNFRFHNALMQLDTFSRAMGYLLEHSVNQFATSLKSALTKKDSSTSKNKDINAILREVEEMKSAGGFVPHAKMDRTKSILLAHFAKKEDGDGKDDDFDPEETRVMVFCSFRECLNELVATINQEAPILRAKAFVGQSKDAAGNAGLNQKAQKTAVEDFKEGKYNILVATSIGEEGLDIGGVDMIICYDASKSSVRMLQRVGRTGRKKDGIISVLMGEGREEKNWASAKDSYESVQDAITRGAHLELFDDVPRLLPAGHRPELVKKEMEIDLTPIEDPNAKKATTKKEPKPRAKKGEPKAERGTPIPKGAATSFVMASELRKKHIPAVLEDDSDDAAIEAGPTSFLSRFNSAPSGGGKGGKGKGKGKARAIDLSDNDDNDDDEQLQRGKKGKGIAAKRAKTTSALSDKKRRVEEVDGSNEKLRGFHRPQVPSRALKDRSSSPEEPPVRPPKKLKVVQPPPKLKPPRLMEFSSSPGPDLPPSPPPRPFPPAPPERAAPQPPPISKARPPPPPPPPVERPPAPAPIVAPRPRAEAGPSIHRLPPDLAAKAGFSDIDMSWVLADDDEDWQASLPASRALPPPPPPTNGDAIMAPPSFPHHRLSSPNFSTEGSPSFSATQHPIRRGGIRPRLKTVVSSSPVAGSSSAAATILKRPFKAPIPRSFQQQQLQPNRKGTARGPPPADVRRYLGVDADDDRSDSAGTISDDGSAADDQETEEDRRFAGDFLPTQAPKGYDQHAAYRAGSQALGGPLFGRSAQGGRREQAMRGELFKRRAPRASESPMSVRGSAGWENEDEDEDGYGTGGDFVVADEEPIVYDPSSDI